VLLISIAAIFGSELSYEIEVTQLACKAKTLRSKIQNFKAIIGWVGIAPLINLIKAKISNTSLWYASILSILCAVVIFIYLTTS
jgi:hypothetical protein